MAEMKNKKIETCENCGARYAVYIDQRQFALGPNNHYSPIVDGKWTCACGVEHTA